MKSFTLLFWALLFFVGNGFAQNNSTAIDGFINSETQYLDNLYLYLHQHPELSLQDKTFTTRHSLLTTPYTI